MTMRVAVVGATGNVGREMLKTLAERRFPVSKVHAVASKRSAGKKVSFGENDVLTVEDLASAKCKRHGRRCGRSRNNRYTSRF